MDGIRVKDRKIIFPNGKDVFLFWSGGADSTYLLLQNLRCDYKLTVGYVDIENNKDKSIRETAARKWLKQDIKKFCEYFNRNEPEYKKDNRLYINGGNNSAPQQTIFALFSILYADDYDEIHFGIVLGDSMYGYIDFYKDMLKVYDKVSCRTAAEVKFPIEDVSKESIYLTLKGYDDLIGTEFIKHITVCENHMESDKCTCKPCQTRREVFKKLNWLPQTEKEERENENKYTQQ